MPLFVPGVMGSPVGGTISIIDDFTNTGATSVASPGSFTVGGGSNRCLGLVQFSAGNPSDEITAITWGGRSMTRQVRADSGGGFPINVAIWTLLEAEIALAVGTAFVYTGTTAGDDRAFAFTLGGVSQVTPVVDTGSGVLSGSNPADVVLTTENGGVAVAGCSFDNTTDENIDWASPFDLNESALITTGAVPGGNSYRAARAATDGSNITSDVATGDSSFQQCQCAVSFGPA